MAKFNLEELLGGIQEATLIAKGISERQHINNLSSYFNDDGTPRTTSFNINGNEMVVPLFVLADHSSIGLSELEMEFKTKLTIGDNEPGKLKRGLLSFLRRRESKGHDVSEHSIKNLQIDSGTIGKDSNGMAKIRVVFKADEKPEAISRLVDRLIQNIDDHTHIVKD
ncbi:MAG: DUF2589 domain-containing protein [Pseudomonadales bacterium]|jgi:hypothetical protein